MGPNGWVQQVNFLVFGLLTMAHAIGLHRGMGPARGGWVGPALLFITGIGLLAAGTFSLREDAAGITYDPGGHTVAGMIFFLGSPAALIVLSRRMWHDPSWRGLAPYTLGSGLVFLALAIVGMVFASPAAAPLHDWAGLVQGSWVVALLFPCRIALGVRQLSRSREPITRSPAHVSSAANGVID